MDTHIAEDGMTVNGTQSREQQFLGVFQKITRLTSMVFDHQEVMDTIVRSLPDLLTIDACTIRLLDSSIRSFVLGAAHGVSLEYLSREVIDTEETMSMIRSGYPVYNAHVDEDPFLPFREAASREGIKSVLTLPILYQGELIGIMRLLTRSARSFSSGEISFAMALGRAGGHCHFPWPDVQGDGGPVDLPPRDPVHLHPGQFDPGSERYSRLPC